MVIREAVSELRRCSLPRIYRLCLTNRLRRTYYIWWHRSLTIYAGRRPDLCWTVHFNFSMMHPCIQIIRVANLINLYRLMGYIFYLLLARTRYISYIIIYVGIVYKYRVLDDV